MKSVISKYATPQRGLCGYGLDYTQDHVLQVNKANTYGTYAGSTSTKLL